MWFSLRYVKKPITYVRGRHTRELGQSAPLPIATPVITTTTIVSEINIHTYVPIEGGAVFSENLNYGYLDSLKGGL